MLLTEMGPLDKLVRIQPFQVMLALFQHPPGHLRPEPAYKAATFVS